MHAKMPTRQQNQCRQQPTALPSHPKPAKLRGQSRAALLPRFMRAAGVLLHVRPAVGRSAGPTIWQISWAMPKTRQPRVTAGLHTLPCRGLPHARHLRGGWLVPPGLSAQPAPSTTPRVHCFFLCSWRPQQGKMCALHERDDACAGHTKWHGTGASFNHLGLHSEHRHLQRDR